jgi:6-phosphogluconate dehydrogenase (decarboxylating)
MVLRPSSVDAQRLVPPRPRGDIIVDGGNSYCRDDIGRVPARRPRGSTMTAVEEAISVSKRGCCLMIGGEPASSVIWTRSSRFWLRRKRRPARAGS